MREAPAVEPLNAEFFRGNTAQTAADWNALLHHVVFGGAPAVHEQIENTFQDHRAARSANFTGP